MLKKNNFIKLSDPKFDVKMEIFKQRILKDGFEPDTRAYNTRVRFYWMVCHVILTLRRYNNAVREKMKSLRNDAYMDKIIKPAHVSDASSEDDEEFLKLKKRENKIQLNDDEQDIKEAKSKPNQINSKKYESKVSDVSGNFFGVNNDSSRNIEKNQSVNYKEDQNEDANQKETGPGPYNSIVQSKFGQENDTEKPVDNDKKDLKNMLVNQQTSNETEKASCWIKVIDIIYFPLIILWKITLPEFWFKKNFGIGHVIWGYLVCLVWVGTLIFLIMTFECNCFNANGWEPPLFGLI